MIKGYQIIVPFKLSWDWSADYQKQTCLVLSRENKVITYMQCDRHFFLFPSFKKYPKIKNVLFYVPKYYIPFSRFSLIENLNHKISLYLFNLTLWGNKIILWIFNPEFDFYPKIFKRSVSIYDCVDYHSSTEGNIQEEIEKKERELIRICDYFFVNSQVLSKVKSKMGKPNVVVPQGFRVQDFSKPKKTSVRFKRLAKGKPIIGFVGGINYRLDFELLFSLISKNKKWCFVFWGPIQKDSQDEKFHIQENIKKLLSFQNVVNGFSKDRREIASIIKQFDVAMIPYDTSQLINKYCYPMKLFEYFYMGKPVISTPIEELKRFPKFVKIGKNVREWERNIKKLINKPWSKAKIEERRKLAITNSWEEKNKFYN